MTGGAVLRLASVAEAATGLALLVVPSLVGRLLFGAGLSGLGVPAAQVAGAALVGLALACWPVRAGLGMLVYSTLVAGLLGAYGATGEAAGALLWPAVGLHVLLSVALSLDLVRRSGG